MITTFDLREGNGRLKNMLGTKKHMPPRILINCVVHAADCPPIMAEIQIYLAGIKKLADQQHRFYEIRRAKALSELLAEAAAHAKQEPEEEVQPLPCEANPEGAPQTRPALQQTTDALLEQQAPDAPPEAPEASALWGAFCNT